MTLMPVLDSSLVYSDEPWVSEAQDSAKPEEVEPDDRDGVFSEQQITKLLFPNVDSDRYPCPL